MTDTRPTAILALDAVPRTKPSVYPEPFYSLMLAREKRTLGDLFGLGNFGVNITRLLPGGQSALRHYHSKQDEFIYIISGYPTLVTDEGETPLAPGMCAGFPAGVPNGHMIINQGTDDAVYLEIGDRTPGDTAEYPDDDLAAEAVPGGWKFTHKDGTPYG